MQNLNVIDENENIIGEDSRENIHKNGLLHREINVWIYNNQGEILFQRRAKTKDTFPGLLDASAGGHVEIGDDYFSSAIKEIREETGLEVEEEKLIYLTKMRHKSVDLVTGNINNAVKKIYAYRFDGDAGDLKIEDGKATSLEFWKIDKILNLNKKELKEFIPAVIDKKWISIFNKIKNLN